MPLKTLDHVNIRTANLEAMTEWYEAVLGMENGARPDFGFPGAWLYLDGKPIVHLVGVATDPVNTTPKLEHFAISATGMTDFCDDLDRYGVAHSVDPVPGFPIVQINFRDPDGNHIHVDFDTSEVS